jgi:Aminoglycoside N3''-acetyltransferase
MSEKDVVARTAEPVTTGRMVHDLRRLGVEDGDVLLVHSSLSSIGWVCGGPQAVVEALLRAVGGEGTLVMPAQTGDWSDPAEWQNPPVPAEWHEIIYREWPAFDPDVTPTRGMGRIAELFRTYPGTKRSGHPQVSFCANGRHADAIVSEHPLTPQFGMPSPLGKMYGMRAKVLLLGVGYHACTSFHLAETRLPSMPVKRMGAAIRENGERVWRWFEDYAYDADDFNQIGREMEGSLSVRKGTVGQAECRLFDMREAVDFAAQWMAENRRKQRNGT